MVRGSNGFSLLVPVNRYPALIWLMVWCSFSACIGQSVFDLAGWIVTVCPCAVWSVLLVGMSMVILPSVLVVSWLVCSAASSERRNAAKYPTSIRALFRGLIGLLIIFRRFSGVSGLACLGRLLRP